MGFLSARDFPSRTRNSPFYAFFRKSGVCRAASHVRIFTRSSVTLLQPKFFEEEAAWPRHAPVPRRGVQVARRDVQGSNLGTGGPTGPLIKRPGAPPVERRGRARSSSHTERGRSGRRSRSRRFSLLPLPLIVVFFSDGRPAGCPFSPRQQAGESGFHTAGRDVLCKVVRPHDLSFFLLR